MILRQKSLLAHWKILQISAYVLISWNFKRTRKILSIIRNLSFETFLNPSENTKPYKTSSGTSMVVHWNSKGSVLIDGTEEKFCKKGNWKRVKYRSCQRFLKSSLFFQSTELEIVPWMIILHMDTSQEPLRAPELQYLFLWTLQDILQLFKPIKLCQGVWSRIDYFRM